MLNMHRYATHQYGYGLIEVLVSLLIALIGLLGLAGLITQSQQAEMESYQRAQALILLQDMVNRINVNRKVAHCYTTSSPTTTSFGTNQYFGVGSTLVASCGYDTTTPLPVQKTGNASASDAQMGTAVMDMVEWDDDLKGSAESSGGSNVGAIIGARGCVVELAADTYMVSVAWQGLSSTFAPPSGLNCAKNLYGGDDSLRRVVSLTLRVANLSGT
jgi:type IV pilus assembly protein PilV